jgi:hypothetical protein
MKKYILTIKYDENTDEVEWIQEEIIIYKDKEITRDNLTNIDSEDMIRIFEDKDYAEA